MLCAVTAVPLCARAQTPAPATPVVAPAPAKQDGPPLRDGDAVLFRFHAPAGAEKVFLAGSFNNYADNVNGAVTDPKFALNDAGDGYFWTRALVEPKREQYKFVVLGRDGQFTWLPDPNVATADADGNSVLDFGEIGRLPLAATGEGAPVRLPNGEVLFRFRAPADAQRVFLAGSFNGFADNQNGAVSGEKYALLREANGLYTKRESIGAATEKYKFVVLDKTGKYLWLADPNVRATDADGNTVVDFSKIERLP